MIDVCRSAQNVADPHRVVYGTWNATEKYSASEQIHLDVVLNGVDPTRQP